MISTKCWEINKMFEKIKNNIAHAWVVKKYSKKNPPVVSFSNFFSKSVYYFIIIPSNSMEFEQSLSVLKYLDLHKKNITIFCHEEAANLIPSKSKFKFIVYTNDEITKLNLPNSSLVRMLKKKSFDTVIDLNLSENVFACAAANIVESEYKVGFVKKNSDKYYNLQITNDKNNTEFSYKNLLNSLEMF